MKRELSTAAKAAKAIKLELKKAYPYITFKVTSDNFSMGTSVGTRWTDGPTEKAVREITDKYQYGHFNSMEDIYEHSNVTDDIPQAKFVTAGRDISDEVYKAALIKARDYLPGFYEATELGTTLHIKEVNEYITAKQFLWRYLNKCDLSQGFRPTMLHPDVWNKGVEPINEVKCNYCGLKWVPRISSRSPSACPECKEKEPIKSKDEEYYSQKREEAEDLLIQDLEARDNFKADQQTQYIPFIQEILDNHTKVKCKEIEQKQNQATLKTLNNLLLYGEGANR